MNRKKKGLLEDKGLSEFVALQSRSTKILTDTYLLLATDLIPAIANENAAIPSSMTNVLIEIVPAVGGDDLIMFNGKTAVESARSTA